MNINDSLSKLIHDIKKPISNAIMLIDFRLENQNKQVERSLISYLEDLKAQTLSKTENNIPKDSQLSEPLLQALGIVSKVSLILSSDDPSKNKLLEYKKQLESTLNEIQEISKDMEQKTSC